MRYTPEHKYPPMLGPLEHVPTGTAEWAERLGLQFMLGVKDVEKWGGLGIDRLIPALELALKAKPWTFWPDPPCLTPERFFLYTAGIGCADIIKLITAYRGEIDIVRQLRDVGGISPMQDLQDAWDRCSPIERCRFVSRVLPDAGAA